MCILLVCDRCEEIQYITCFRYNMVQLLVKEKLGQEIVCTVHSQMRKIVICYHKMPIFVLYVSLKWLLHILCDSCTLSFPLNKELITLYPEFVFQSALMSVLIRKLMEKRFWVLLKKDADKTLSQCDIHPSIHCQYISSVSLFPAGDVFNRKL